MEWFKRWFNESYLELYSHRDESEARVQVQLLLSLLESRPSGIVCDVGCGTGRHLQALIDSGISAIGVDLSHPLLKHAVNLPVVRADMRHLPFRDDCLGGVTSFFTSFGYFQTDAEHLALLKEYRRVLSPGGFIFLDLPNREWVKENLVADEELTTDSGSVRITRQITADNRVIKSINFAGESYQEDVRLFSAEEITALMDQAGFGELLLRENSSRMYVLGHDPS